MWLLMKIYKFLSYIVLISRDFYSKVPPNVFYKLKHVPKELKLVCYLKLFMSWGVLNTHTINQKKSGTAKTGNAKHKENSWCFGLFCDTEEARIRIAFQKLYSWLTEAIQKWSDINWEVCLPNHSSLFETRFKFCETGQAAIHFR